MRANIFTAASIIKSMNINLKDNFEVFYNKYDNQVDITATMDIDSHNKCIMSTEIFENTFHPSLNMLLKSNISNDVLIPLLEIDNELFKKELERVNIYVKHFPKIYGFVNYDVADYIDIIANIMYDREGKEVINLSLEAKIKKHSPVFATPSEFDIEQYIVSEINLIGYTELTGDTDMELFYNLLEAYYLVEEMKEI